MCEIWPLSSVNICEIDIIWNIGFDVFLTAAGEKVLNRSSFIVELCRYLILNVGERQLLFYRRPFCSDNIVLRTLAGLVRFEMLGIVAKYDIN